MKNTVWSTGSGMTSSKSPKGAGTTTDGMGMSVR
jgi:hypothetical protein